MVWTLRKSNFFFWNSKKSFQDSQVEQWVAKTSFWFFWKKFTPKRFRNYGRTDFTVQGPRVLKHCKLVFWKK
jgi:hypothetical protein